MNVYGPPQENPSFAAMANLFDPRTVDASFAHDGYGPIPRIKTDRNKWDLTGHQDRLIRVTKEDLKIYAALYDQPGTPYTQAKLPGLHCTPLKEAVRTLARVPQRIGDFKDRYYATSMWNETNAVKDGTIRRETRFTEGALILSGPHIFVGHPYFKTPNRECRFNSHYTRLDLMTLPTDYRPRTNYVPACEDYEARIPVTPWGTKATEGFRIAIQPHVRGGQRALVHCRSGSASSGACEYCRFTSIALHARDPWNCAEILYASLRLPGESNAEHDHHMPVDLLGQISCKCRWIPLPRRASWG